ncbi:MAG: preprotein translocase subunit SecY [Mycoplasmatales bacterium]|nr:preprotein translocase subunit SecY [Mycoplasmatales bacterium]
MDKREQDWFTPIKKDEEKSKPKKNNNKKNNKINSKSILGIFSKVLLFILIPFIWFWNLKWITKIRSFFKSWKKSIKNVLKSKPLIGKILITLLLIVTFRVAASITTPGVVVQSGFGNDSSSFVGIMDMMGGGALRNFSIVALGISPYITSSIIMTLLQSEVFPPLYRLSRSGPAGKRKINIITRILTLIFAIIQSITIIQQLSGPLSLVSLKEPFNTALYRYFALPVILMSGSLFTLFLGEQITKRGVGNGTSLIIFSGIAVNIPSKFKAAFDELVVGAGDKSVFVGAMNLILYTLVFLILIYIIGYFYKAERHVPIQQTGAGMTKKGNKISHLPIKLNPSGVMPIIFALSISILPVTIAQFLDYNNEARIWLEDNMRLTAPIGLAFLISLTFLFTIAMSMITFNPYNVADNFKKNGTFIPGIKPGEQTENYLTGIILRLSIFSAIYLSIITSIQYVEQIIGLDRNMTIGGTSIIILVTVSIETLSQLKARDQTNKISRAQTKTRKSTGGTTEGLLW